AGGLTPGWHGLHMHQVADCRDTAKFESAKAHAKHEGQAHGYLSAEGPEAGDLPNLSVAQDGSAVAEATSFLASLSGEKNILDADGFAVVIHAKEDDHRDSKSAGARVACAEIKAQ
ncbi:MAG TPA: superoxide dismutase family protein, partial [Aestuariivirga sp.]|nr:superoxide dismutase family protein [Aestuariivirga sp.]